MAQMQFENGDRVREKNGTQILTIMQVQVAGLYGVQLGNDAATLRLVKGDNLELVAKVERPDPGPGFYPARSIME
jgi:hypothetical protein